MEKYLLNTKTGIISREGDEFEGNFLTFIAEEIEVEGGFKMVGTIEETGEKLESFLNTEDYFEGKHFKVIKENKEKTYKEFKKEKQEKFDNFEGKIFAFSKTQLEKGMKRLNAEPKDFYNMGCGMFILKSRIKEFEKMMDDFDNELKEKLHQDYNFCYDAFKYELSNHEYNITYELNDTLNSLDLAYEEVMNNEIIKKALENAKKYVIENSCW